MIPVDVSQWHFQHYERLHGFAAQSPQESPHASQLGLLPDQPRLDVDWQHSVSPFEKLSQEAPLRVSLQSAAAGSGVSTVLFALALGLAVIENEARSVAALGARIDDSFVDACGHMLGCRGRIVVLGMGKSGHVGGKIAATLASTGSPAFFVHPGEASHGDLGMITSKDVVLALSNSGETDELLTILPIIKRLNVPLISMTGNPESTLAKAAAVNLHVGVEKEACPLDLAPTSSTTAALVMGDALAVALLRRQLSWDGFKNAILDTTRTSAMVMLIVTGAGFFVSLYAASYMAGLGRCSLLQAEARSDAVVFFLEHQANLGLVRLAEELVERAEGVAPRWFGRLPADSCEVRPVEPHMEQEAPPAPFAPPDVIIQVVDATALERHLELTIELSQLGKPMVLALNMMDEARQKGVHINSRTLSEQAAPRSSRRQLSRTAPWPRGTTLVSPATISTPCVWRCPTTGTPT